MNHSPTNKVLAWTLLAVSAILVLFASGVLLMSQVGDAPMNWGLWMATFVPGMILLIIAMTLITKVPTQSDSPNDETTEQREEKE